MKWMIFGLLLVQIGCTTFRTREDCQRDYFEAVSPADQPPARHPQKAATQRTITLHVYADEDYRRVRRWRVNFERMLEKANTISGRALGVRFVVAEFSDWHRGMTAVDLPGPLDALTRQDVRAEWVVGLVSASPRVTPSVNQLGLAKPFARHIVLRSADSIQEHQAIQRVFDELPTGERASLYRRRKQHRLTTMFLRQWAITLSASATHDPTTIMYPTTSASQDGFDPSNVALIHLGLEHAPAAFGDAAQMSSWRAAVAQSKTTAKGKRALPNL